MQASDHAAVGRVYQVVEEVDAAAGNSRYRRAQRRPLEAARPSGPKATQRYHLLGWLVAEICRRRRDAGDDAVGVWSRDRAGRD